MFGNYRLIVQHSTRSLNNRGRTYDNFDGHANNLQRRKSSRWVHQYILLDDIPKLREILDIGTVIIRGAVLHIDKYKVIGQLLDDVYTQHLYKRYKPMTYGSKWLLLGMGRFGRFDRVLAPWAWLKGDREAFRQWTQNSSLLTCNMRPGSVWTIGMPKPSQCIGIASRDHRFLDTIRNHAKAFAIASERLLEPTKDELSDDPGLIEEVLNKEAVFGVSVKGGKTYLQVGEEAELEEFLSYWDR